MSSYIFCANWRGAKVEPALERPGGQVSKRPAIVVVLPVVWSVRNVVYSGVLNHLASRDIDVHLLMKQWPASQAGVSRNDRFEKASSCGEMICDVPNTARVAGLLDDVVKEGFFCRAGMRSLHLSASWFQRDASSRTRLRTRIVQAAGGALGRSRAFPRVRQWHEKRWLRRYSSQAVKTQLQRLNPTVVWLTLWGLAGEESYLSAARALGVPLVTSIVGFDNPFTQGFRPRFDRYYVWNEAMQDALMQIEPDLSRSRVAVTGTPQFDFHRRETMRWGRPETLARLGIPTEDRYFLYAANHPVHTPNEPALLRRLVDRLGEDERLGQHRVVVRLHPLDSTERWRSIDGNDDRLVLSRPFHPPCDDHGWSVSSLEDQALLVSSLMHADACINIASTIALDAAILDRPTISLELSAEPDSRRGIFFSEYSSEYYRQLVDSGGLSMAHSWDEVKALLRQAVDNPGAVREGRRAMVRAVCGDVDGKAADRLSKDLSSFVTSVHEMSESSNNWQQQGSSC